jgi:Domain of unknown function (DUF389)
MLPRVHRNFVVVGAVAALRQVARDLEPLAEVITLALDESTAIKPEGGVLDIQALNRSADDVLRRLRPFAERGEVVILIGSASSIIDVRRQEMIDHDADTMLWEEIQQNLRNEGRTSVNSVALMGLGGAVTAAALVAPPPMQLLALLAASIIAPGFAPIAGISLGLVLRRFRVAGRAALATCIGYGVTTMAAALTFLLLRALEGNPATRRIAPEVVQLIALDAASVVISATAAIAGAIMIVSLRDIYVIGSLIALALIPAAATAGCAAITGEWHVVRQALALVGVDAVLVIAGSAAVFWVEQRLVHRRRPLA